MSIFAEKYPKREDFIKTSYEIDISLYEKLEKLSKETYDASINKLFNTCLEYILETKKLDLYPRSPKEITVFRSFLIRKSIYVGITDLKEKYNISQQKIVNIAIYNALSEENINN